MNACIISSPASAYACYFSERPTDHSESRSGKDMAQGRVGIQPE